MKTPIVGMLICNDRRWAEGWRVYGLQGTEIMCIGYVRFISSSSWIHAHLGTVAEHHGVGARALGHRPDQHDQGAGLRRRHVPPQACVSGSRLHQRQCAFPTLKSRPSHALTRRFAAFLITSARCGVDDGIHTLISGSMIVSPEGHIIAENKTEEDEVVWADIDLDACRQGKDKTFAFEKHRRIEHYGLIVERAGVIEPEETVV